MEPDIIYMVTVFKNSTNGQRSRCWGWYKRYDNAVKAVVENHTDIFEMDYYDTAVIEAVPQGVCVVSTACIWFSATYEDEESDNPTVLQIPRPEWAESSFNFGLG